MRGDIPQEALEPGGDWPPLYETFEEMLQNLRDGAFVDPE
jgi:hypothetical protein